ncbi:MAG: pyroglutamyl-peptidase I [Ruminococcaceae bacterium]|nr:pyroglutamyl-peptidase I [Oscillospiraceae bacterium]
MKRVLITGFDPFGGESINPSWEAVCRLPDAIGEIALCKRQIPTVFGAAPAAVLAAAADVRPDAILCVGQAGGRAAVTPEYVGINLCHARIADNAGRKPQDESVVPDGPAAYFSTLPVRRMVEAVLAAGVPCACSYSAGTFVCNEVLYALLHHFRGSGVRVGFIHVPFLPQQVETGQPSLSLESISAALQAAVTVLFDE